LNINTEELSRYVAKVVQVNEITDSKLSRKGICVKSVEEWKGIKYTVDWPGFSFEHFDLVNWSDIELNWSNIIKSGNLFILHDNIEKYEGTHSGSIHFILIYI
jgi:hypothetical protein